MPDQAITCKDQEFFKRNNWNDPIRCRPCRNLAKQRRPKQDQQSS